MIQIMTQAIYFVSEVYSSLSLAFKNKCIFFSLRSRIARLKRIRTQWHWFA